MRFRIESEDESVEMKDTSIIHSYLKQSHK